MTYTDRDDERYKMNVTYDKENKTTTFLCYGPTLEAVEVILTKEDTKNLKDLLEAQCE